MNIKTNETGKIAFGKYVQSKLICSTAFHFIHTKHNPVCHHNVINMFTETKLMFLKYDHLKIIKYFRVPMYMTNFNVLQKWVLTNIASRIFFLISSIFCFFSLKEKNITKLV